MVKAKKDTVILFFLFFFFVADVLKDFKDGIDSLKSDKGNFFCVYKYEFMLIS